MMDIHVLHERGNSIEPGRETTISGTYTWLTQQIYEGGGGVVFCVRKLVFNSCALKGVALELSYRSAFARW